MFNLFEMSLSLRVGPTPKKPTWICKDGGLSATRQQHGITATFLSEMSIQISPSVNETVFLTVTPTTKILC